VQTCNAAEALAPIISHFEETGIKYCLSGSLAATFYGTCESWADVELLTELSPAHVRRLVDAVQPSYWTDRQLAGDTVADKSSFTMVHLPTAMKVVVNVSKRRPYDLAAMSRIRQDKFDDASAVAHLSLLSPEDVVLNTLEQCRLGDDVSDRRWRDVIGVMKVNETALDRQYMERWAADLGVADLL
jgi:hypothetical protein